MYPFSAALEPAFRLPNGLPSKPNCQLEEILTGSIFPEPGSFTYFGEIAVPTACFLWSRCLRSATRRGGWRAGATGYVRKVTSRQKSRQLRRASSSCVSLGGPAFIAKALLGRRALRIAFRNALRYPVLHLGLKPANAIRSELEPPRKQPCRFKPVDGRGGVANLGDECLAAQNSHNVLSIITVNSEPR